jgi:hypothetical protein
LEDGELVPQGENLDFKLRSRTDSGANGGEERNQNGAHVRVSISAPATNRDERACRISDNDGVHDVWMVDARTSASDEGLTYRRIMPTGT